MSAHIFIDAENVKPEIGLSAIEKFSRAFELDSVDIIGKETAISPKYHAARATYRIQNCHYGKNSADTWLCTEIARTIFEKPEVEVIVLVSSDRDFLPAIKLATEQNRKVIVVSDGLGHKNLKAMLYDLRINPELIELVDFRGIANIQKRGANKPMEKTLPSGRLDKLHKICAKLPPNTKNFFVNRSAKVKFIFVKHGDRLAEIPFLDGINLQTFTNVLRDFKIIGRNDTAGDVIAASFLKVVDNAVHICSEAELRQIDEAAAAVESDADFLETNAANAKTIFVKHGDSICEVPFVDGIPAEIFSAILKKRGILTNLSAVVRDSFLDMRGGRIYFRAEEDIFNYVEPNLKSLSAESRSFLSANEPRVEKIPLIYSNATYKIPFVDGMHLSVLVHILRDLKIFTKSTPTLRVLANNGLVVENNIVRKN